VLYLYSNSGRVASEGETKIFVLVWCVLAILWR